MKLVLKINDIFSHISSLFFKEMYFKLHVSEMYVDNIKFLKTIVSETLAKEKQVIAFIDYCTQKKAVIQYYIAWNSKNAVRDCTS